MTQIINNRQELAEYFNSLGFKLGAEIGVLGGGYSIKLCKANSELKLYCIDSWGINEIVKREYHLRKYEEAMNRLSNYNAIIIRRLSMDAVKHFDYDSLDFVYIDANHKFDYVMQDIIEWTKRVKVGGIVSGHDYNSYFVKIAVDSYVKCHNLDLNITNNATSKEGISWWFTKK